MIVGQFDAHIAAWSEHHFVPRHFGHYHPDGRIQQFGSGGLDGIIRDAELLGLAWIVDDAGVDGDRDYVDVTVDPHVARRREPNPAHLDGLVMRELPVPCDIEIAGPDGRHVYPFAGPALRLSFDHPGAYTVRVLATRCLPAEFQVTAP